MDIRRRSSISGTWFLGRFLPTIAVLLLLLSALPHALGIDLGLRADIQGPLVGSPRIPLTFNGSGSQGAIANYTWDFHDGGLGYGSRVTHSFGAEGRYTVALAVTGFSGHQALSFVVVEVRNRAPIARIAAQGAATQGAPVTFDARGSEDPEGLGLTQSWDFGDGHQAQGAMVTHAFTRTGEFRVRLIAEDPAGGVGYTDHLIAVTNTPPTVRLVGPPRLAEGQVGTFDASRSTDSGSDAIDLLFAWDFGDGSRASGPLVQHSFSRPGQYRVVVTAVDDGGLRATASMPVEVTNLAPGVAIDAPSMVFEGTPFVARAVVNETPNDAPGLAFTWSTGSSGVRTVISPWDEGVIPLSVGVKDDDGTSASASTTVRVLNAPPLTAITDIYATATFTLYVKGKGATPATLTILRSGTAVGSASLARKDAGPFYQSATVGPLDLRVDEEWRAIIQFGAQALPEDREGAPIFLKITFDDGDEVTLHHKLERDQSSTWVWLINLNRVMAGHALHAVGEVFDPGSDDLTLTWQFPGERVKSRRVAATSGRSTFARDFRTFTLDGCEEEGKATPTPKGGCAVVLSVVDGDGGSASTRVLLHVSRGLLTSENLAPFATLLPLEATVDEDEAVAFEASARDSLSDAPRLQFLWDFGDGETSEGPKVSHAFRNAGIYPIKLRVTDGLATAWQTALVVVRNRPPTAGSVAPLIVGEDQPLFFTAPVRDTPGDLSTMRVLWDFGDGGWATGMMVDHAYARSGSYKVALRAADDDGANVVMAFDVKVLNAPPRVSILAPPGPREDHSLILTAEVIDDPSDVPLMEYSWVLGGQPLVGRRVAVRAPVGTLTVTVVATDDDGASGSSKKEVTVEPFIPSLRLPDLRLNGDGELRDAGLTLNGPLRQGALLRWNFGDGNSDIGTSPIHIYRLDGIFLLTLEVLVGPIPRAKAQSAIMVHLDRDGDGIEDAAEVAYGSNPLAADTDGDGQLDPTELRRARPTRPEKADSDGDGLWDGFNITSTGVVGELSVGTDPLNPDTDGDGLGDGAEVLGWSVKVTRDGLQVEYAVTSDPLRNDTDLDGVLDFQERTLGLDPRDPDTDRDGLDDLEETTLGDDGAITSPRTPDTDSDGVWDFFDRTPAGTARMSWNDRYPPGLIRFTQDYSVYSVRGLSAYVYKYSLQGGCGFVADRVSDSTKSSAVREGSVRDQVFGGLVRGGQVNYTPYKATQLPGVSSEYYTYTAGECDLFRPNKYAITYEIPRARYSVSFLNGKETTAKDEDGNPQLYALADVGVELGKDQSVIIQFSILPEKDRTTGPSSTKFTVPALAYSLHRDRHFAARGPFYSNLAVAAPLSDHAYEAEIRMPAEQLTNATASPLGNRSGVTLMILPVWVTSSSAGLSRRAMDPLTLTIASITRETSLSATQLIARLATNLTDLRRYLPENVTTYATGYYSFGPYSVYVFNFPEKPFDEASLGSVDAIVFVETSQARLVRLRESISWEKNRGWVENYNDAFNTSTRSFNFLLRATKLTIRLAELHDLGVYQSLGISQITLTNKGRETIVVEKVSVAGEVRYLVSRVDKGYSTVWTMQTSAGVVTGEVYVWSSSREEVLSDIRKSAIVSEKYQKIKGGIKAGQVGLVAVIQGREAAFAYAEGNTIKGTVYAATAVGGGLSVYAADVRLQDLNVRGRLGRLRVGAVAAIASAALLVSYEVYQGASLSDPIRKRSHLESASATAIDSAIVILAPGYGFAVQFGWLGGNLLMSYVMPNDIASKITSSPGSTITFFFEYFFSSEVPSAIASDALTRAHNVAIEFAKIENQQGGNVVVIPAS